MSGIMTESGNQWVLVERAREGDRTAFDELFMAFEDRVRAFIRSRIRPGYREQLDAEEILQDTFVRAFQSIGSFRGEDTQQFRRWLSGVARKTVLRAEEAARKRGPLEIRENLESIASDVVSPGHAMRREERFDRLQAAIDSLSGDHREVILLTRIQGMSLKRAAEKMGRSPEAVRKLFWRALKQLRSVLTNTASLHLPDRRLESEEGDESRR